MNISTLKTLKHNNKIAAVNDLSVRRVVLALACLSWSFTLPQQKPRSEYQLKAVFLYNFTQFVIWPDKAFAHSQAPFVLGVLGEDPFQVHLDEIVHGESVNGHPLIVKRYKTSENIDDCHLLFINLKNPDRIKEALNGIKGKSILTVSDAPNFIRMGGMVRFLREGNKVRFMVNPEAANASGLTISSKLLNLAVISTP